ncbi:MAG: hypothetical protein WBG48_13910 [Pricia sp.]
MKFYLTSLLVLCICCASLFSCVEEQDFTQYDDINVTPTAEASILYIEAPESAINAAGDADVISRNFNFDAFSSDVFAERVLDGSVTYIVENTTSKDVTIRIELIGEVGNVLDIVIIDVDAMMPRQVTEIFYGSAARPINLIKETSSIRVTATNRGDNSSTSDLPDPKIILKSSGKFRLQLK